VRERGSENNNNVTYFNALAETIPLQTNEKDQNRALVEIELLSARRRMVDELPTLSLSHEVAAAKKTRFCWITF
jgi:hypothetical protein